MVNVLFTNIYLYDLLFIYCQMTDIIAYKNNVFHKYVSLYLDMDIWNLSLGIYDLANKRGV